ncbi:MAG: DUF6515 family protein [Phycisphaerae bacterium]
MTRSYPRYGTRITQLPGRHRIVSHRGRDFYYVNGIYYRRYPGGYYAVVRPPLGFRLDFLPYGFASVTIGGRPYYRYQNTYYVQEYVDNQPSYVVVQPPQEYYIDYLPADAQQVFYKGRTFYVDIYEEVAYEAVHVDGQLRYRATDLDVDVDFEDEGIEIELDD